MKHCFRGREAPQPPGDMRHKNLDTGLRRYDELMMIFKGFHTEMED